MKRYDDEARNYIIEKRKETIPDITRKNVQMHMFARNYVQLMNGEIDNVDESNVYGEETLKYLPAYYGNCASLEEPVFLEPYLDGKWEKFINNNGARLPWQTF